MKTLLTTEDMKNIIDTAFNGNLWISRLSKGEIPYENENDEQILIVNEETGEQNSVSMAEYLNIKFYDWKYRVSENDGQYLAVFDNFISSINVSLDKAYALVEFTGEEAIASQDFDSATDNGVITFEIQSNKIKNFDYYARKIRNSFLGVPQTITNKNGEELTAFITIGIPTYSEEPSNSPLGETIIGNIGFTISYVNSALTYSDFEFSLSFDNVNFYTIPLIKLTWKEIFSSEAVPKANRPDMTGFINTLRSCTKTLAFYDYKASPFSKQLKRTFFELSAIKVNNTETIRKSVNIPIWLKVLDKEDNITYTYKDVIVDMERVFINNDFNTASITLRGWGKL